MSVIVRVGGVGSPVAVDPCGTVANLLDTVHAALDLPRAIEDYDVEVRGVDGEVTPLLDPAAVLADVGVLGCEEEVVLSVKFVEVARERLRQGGVVTAADARAALDAAWAEESWERVRLIAAAGIMDLADPLEHALSVGDSDMVKILLQYGARLQDEDGEDTTLLAAVAPGQVDVVQAVLDAGVDRDCRDILGRTVLQNCLQHTDVVRALLDAGFNANEAPGGVTLLMDAATEGSRITVSLLLEKGANPHAVDLGGRNALSHAAGGGHVNIAHLLMHHNVPIDTEEADRRRPLSHAAEHGHVDFIAFLLDKRVDVNAVDKRGMTALAYAAQYGRGGAIDVLVAGGADVNKADSMGWTPYAYSVASVAQVGYDLTHQLRGLGGRAIEIGGRDGDAMTTAVEHGCVDLVKEFLECGVDVDVRDVWNRTALVAAAECGLEPMTELLLARGADVNAVGNDGVTALTAAADESSPAVVRMLLERGADIEARADGLTPILIATVAGEPEIVRVLLDHGARADARDASGRTALSIAEAMWMDDIEAILHEHFAGAQGTTAGADG